MNATPIGSGLGTRIRQGLPPVGEQKEDDYDYDCNET